MTWPQDRAQSSQCPLAWALQMHKAGLATGEWGTAGESYVAVAENVNYGPREASVWAIDMLQRLRAVMAAQLWDYSVPGGLP